MYVGDYLSTDFASCFAMNFWHSGVTSNEYGLSYSNSLVQVLSAKCFGRLDGGTLFISARLLPEKGKKIFTHQI